MRKVWVLAVVVAMLSAFLLLRSGDKARAREVNAAFTAEISTAHTDFESCLVGARDPTDWGVGVAEGLTRNPEIWRSCQTPLREKLEAAIRGAKLRTKGMENYRRALLAPHASGAETSENEARDLCQRAAALRRALTSLQRAAKQAPATQQAPGCAPSGAPMEAVPGPALEDDSVAIWRDAPQLIGRFDPRDSAEVYARLVESRWETLPLPEEAIDGAFDPLGPIAILRGSPQRVVRYQEGEWIEIGRGPKQGVLRHLRSSAEHALVALAEDSETGRFWVLRAPSASGPLGPALALREAGFEGRPECAQPLLREDGTVLVACAHSSKEQGKGTLTLLRHAPGDPAAAQIDIASGAQAPAQIIACASESKRLWIRWGGLYGQAESGRLLGSDDAGKSWSEVGTLPGGGATLCGAGRLLWLGRGPGRKLQIVRCELDGGCEQPEEMYSAQAWRSLDGNSLALVAGHDSLATIFDLRTEGQLRAQAYRLFPDRGSGLDNLRRAGTRLFIRLSTQ